jgi:hypothetical protein
MTPPVATAEPVEIEQTLQQEVRSMTVVKVADAQTFQQAGDRCKAIVALEKKVHEYWDPLVDGAHKTWKALVAKRAEFLDPLAENKKAQSASMKTWEWEQERKREEAERAAQAAAREQAEDAALAAAAAMEKEGTVESKAAAEAIIQAPVAVPQVVVPKTVPAGHGTFTKKAWKAQVTDIKALARAVLAGQVPEQALQGNDVFLGQQVRSLKDAMRWPGVKTWAE